MIDYTTIIKVTEGAVEIGRIIHVNGEWQFFCNEGNSFFSVEKLESVVHKLNKLNNPPPIQVESVEMIQEMLNFLKEDKYVQAVTRYKNVREVSLKDAKCAVDNIKRNFLN